MKTKIVIVFLMFISFKSFSQENMVTVSGGYSFSKIEDSDVTATGWRINGLYEMNPAGSKVAQGVSIGYISISATENVGNETVESTINSVPVYYAPKYMFGNEKFKGFVKGAIGLQFAKLKREGVINVTDNDFGFYGGVGAGIMFFIKDNIFINGEYEIAWASNSAYKDGWMNSAMGGIGFKF